jgi:NAD-dependent SIR2 family protein deacetylase
VVWFGEPLPGETLSYVDNWIESEPVDLMLVIGTSSRVYPAAGYTDEARRKGARVAVINMDPNDVAGRHSRPLGKGDWFFQGDASVIVPEILKSVIGEI